eukprot:Amastigsp_a184293_7.p2 type:complete len:155 gc:universal Amastigsp_a184293_7:750-286(-)
MKHSLVAADPPSASESWQRQAELGACKHFRVLGHVGADEYIRDVCEAHLSKEPNVPVGHREPLFWKNGACKKDSKAVLCRVELGEQRWGGLCVRCRERRKAEPATLRRDHNVATDAEVVLNPARMRNRCHVSQRLLSVERPAFDRDSTEVVDVR